MFEVIFSTQAAKFIKNLEVAQSVRIKRKILALTTSDTTLDVKTIKGRLGYFRLRVGMYRIIYRYDAQTIVVALIDKRSQIYQKFQRIC